MANNNQNTHWQIAADGSLLLEKGASGLEACDDLFTAVLAAAPYQIKIESAKTATTPNGGHATITGAATVWGGCTVTFTYYPDNGRVISILLTKAPHPDYAPPALPAALNGHSSFHGFQQAILITVPEHGTTAGDLWRGMIGQLKIGTKTVTIRTQSGSSRPFFIETEIEQGLGLSDLARLLNTSGHASSDLAELPSEIWQAADTIELTDLKLELNPKDSDLLTYISVKVSLAQGKVWPIIPHELSVGGLWVKLAVDYPLAEARFPILTVGGEVDLAGGKLDITARWPDWAISGELREGTSIGVGALLQHFGLIPKNKPAADQDLAAGFSHLAIHQLTFLAEPFSTPKTFLLSLSITDVWSITLSGQEKFAIEELSLMMNYQGTAGAPAAESKPQLVKGSSGTFGLTFMGKLEIASLRLFLIAQYMGNGWQFEGGTQPDSEIKLGVVLAEIIKKFDVDHIPDAISHMVLKDLRASFNTTTKDFVFTCTGDLPIHENKVVEARINISLTHQGEGQFKRDVDGTITIDQYVFDIHLLQNTHVNLLAATLSFGYDSQLDLKKLLAAVSDADFIKNDLPDLKMNLHDVIFVYLKEKSTPAGNNQPAVPPSKFLFGIDLGAKFDLSHLPLVGKAIPDSQSLSVDDLKILYATADLTAQEVGEINGILPAGVNKLPLLTPPAAAGNTQPAQPQGQVVKAALPQGFNFGAVLNIGGNSSLMTLPASNANDTSPAQGAIAPRQAAAPLPPTTTNWIDIQKSLGPLYFEKVGVDYAQKALWFRLTGSLGLGGFTLDLEGLSFGSSLTNFDPKFDLLGLGVDIQEGSVEIGGMFLRYAAKAADGTPYTEYDGTVVVKTPLASVSAIGSYARYEGHPSLFMYLVLEAPLGGPPFFYVTGLAGGFGYNRALTVPPITQIYQFPLVAEALGNSTPVPGLSSGGGEQNTPEEGNNSNLAAMRNKIMTEIEGIRRYIRPEVGETFFAVGVKFTSFEIIDSFALVTVAFGNRFELNLFGITTISHPPGAEEGVPALIVIEVAVKASYLPDEGFLGVIAVLTPKSHLYDPHCHLTGGLAFYSWFGNQHHGEFVLTVGGYNPHFKVPDYYPQVPRLGLSWVFNDNLSIKGGAYFALTGHVLMAGGFLQALWDSGDLKAWIKLAADFLITFKPFHYEAEFSVDIGAQATIHLFGTHHLSVDLNADLKVWGPSFSGVAKIHIWIVSFKIKFGHAADAPPPIDWPTFRNSFLPAADQQILTITPLNGLIKTLKGYKLEENGNLIETKKDQDSHLIFNRKQFEITTNSVIPITQWTSYTVIEEPDPQEPNKTHLKPIPHAEHAETVGVAPMDLRHDKFQSSHHITIRRISLEKGKTKAVVEELTGLDFDFTPIKKNVPAGLWGNLFQPNVNSKKLVDGTMSGLKITPRLLGEGGHTSSVPRANLSYDTEILNHVFHPDQSWAVQSSQEEASQLQLNANLPARNTLLSFFMEPEDAQKAQGSLAPADLLTEKIQTEKIFANRYAS